MANASSSAASMWGEGLIPKVNSILVGDFAIGQAARRYLSLGTLLIAICIGLATYVSEGWFWNSKVSLRPSLISAFAAVALAFAAVALVGALYARRVVEWAPSVYSILSLALNVTITSLFIEAILGGGVWSITGLSMPYLIAFAILLSWVGLRPVAPLMWTLVLLMGFINLQVVSGAMGFWGFLFILFSTLGLFLQFEQSLRSFRSDFRHDFIGASAATSKTDTRVTSMKPKAL